VREAAARAARPRDIDALFARHAAAAASATAIAAMPPHFTRRYAMPPPCRYAPCRALMPLPALPFRRADAITLLCQICCCFRRQLLLLLFTHAATQCKAHTL